MSKVRRVDYYPDEYIAGVGSKLDATEQGIYWMVCTLVMSEGGPILFDDRRIAGLCRTRPAVIRKVVARLVELGKLRLDGDQLSQKRAQSEVERSANRIQSASENGAKGGRPRQKAEEKQQNEKADGSGGGKLTNNYQLATRSEVSNDTSSQLRPKAPRRRISYPPLFEEFWSGYPVDSLMSKKEAGLAFAKLDEDEQRELISALPAFKAHCSAHVDYRPVHAVRFISQRRWEGFEAVGKKLGSRIFVAVGSPAWNGIMARRNVRTMPSSDHDGKRGWYFDISEVQAVSSNVGDPEGEREAG